MPGLRRSLLLGSWKGIEFKLLKIRRPYYFLQIPIMVINPVLVAQDPGLGWELARRLGRRSAERGIPAPLAEPSHHALFHSQRSVVAEADTALQ